MENNIKHIFFDLDRTLWDFEKSAGEAFEEIFVVHNLLDRGIPSAKKFHEVYSIHNNRLWDQYRKGDITKDTLRGLRFKLTLKDFGIDNERFGEEIGDDYVRLSPLKVNLFPNAMEVLEYLSSKYTMHIITNGFAEVQAIKLRESGMIKYFKEVITSEEAGVKKPHPGIFNYAFQKSGATPEESIMIGDDYEVDILGAKEMGMKQIFVDHTNSEMGVGSTYRITNLMEIMEIL
jgi:putative hydrolase of the HAD superfamily